MTTKTHAPNAISEVGLTKEEAERIVRDPYRYAQTKGLDAEGKPVVVELHYVPSGNAGGSDQKIKVKFTININIKISNE